jgi:soluble P-type ATPase
VVLAGWDGEARAVLAVADQVKPTSREAFAQLRALGLRPLLLTGDNEATAQAVAAVVGIDEVIAEVMPADKAEVVRRLKSEGRVVAMVGDGVNDAPALVEADLGLLIGTGTDVAIEASDLTLVSGDLRAAADAIRLSRATLRTIKQNLGWAFGYNVAAIPLAAGGLLNPIIAGPRWRARACRSSPTPWVCGASARSGSRDGPLLDGPPAGFTRAAGREFAGVSAGDPARLGARGSPWGPPVDPEPGSRSGGGRRRSSRCSPRTR